MRAVIDKAGFAMGQNTVLVTCSGLEPQPPPGMEDKSIRVNNMHESTVQCLT